MPDKCNNCQRDLDGGIYVSPWEEGNNAYGYVICPHCGCKNVDYSEDDD